MPQETLIEIMPVVLLVGWLLDLLLGDPVWLPHPVVAFGDWIAWWERQLNRGRHRIAKGACLALVSIGLVYGLTWLVLNVLLPIEGLNGSVPMDFWRGVLGVVLSTVIIFFCLAGHTLRREVRDVFLALERGLDDGRRQVARIVGRDTAALSAQEVRTAALETLAENLSDGVVAPLFWLAIGGIPAMIAYKMVNTLDSMIGYRNDRYRQFGCWAARIDDVANYVPARLTALFILLACRVLMLMRIVRPTMVKHALQFVCRYGRAHLSPNSGWPEAALAACLDCRFGGTHNYFGNAVEKPYIGSNPRSLNGKDMTMSLCICLFAEVLALLATCCVMAAV